MYHFVVQGVFGGPESGQTFFARVPGSGWMTLPNFGRNAFGVAGSATTGERKYTLFIPRSGTVEIKVCEGEDAAGFCSAPFITTFYPDVVRTSSEPLSVKNSVLNLEVARLVAEGFTRYQIGRVDTGLGFAFSAQGTLPCAKPEGACSFILPREVAAVPGEYALIVFNELGTSANRVRFTVWGLPVVRAVYPQKISVYADTTVRVDFESALAAPPTLVLDYEESNPHGLLCNSLISCRIYPLS
jgi:hypothetical protein